MSCIRCAPCAILLLLAGCQSRLSADKTYHLNTGATQSFEIDPPRYDQSVVLTMETDAPVTVQVYLKKDADAIEKDLTIKDKSDRILATWSGEGKGTVDATVAAHEIAVVRIEAGKKPANVTIHVAGK